MELEPPSNTSEDVAQDASAAPSPAEPTSPSVFGKAAASIEKATAARNAAASSQGMDGAERTSSSDSDSEEVVDAPDRVMHRAELVDPSSSLPSPAGPVRRSLWKRIKMKARGPEEGVGRAEVSARLKSIESQIEVLDEGVRGRIDGLSDRLDEVWECEEQLSHLVDIQDKLQQVTRNQSELSEALRKSTRRILLLTGCVSLLAGVLALELVARFQ